MRPMCASICLLAICSAGLVLPAWPKEGPEPLVLSLFGASPPGPTSLQSMTLAANERNTPASIGPFEVASEDGGSVLRFQVAAQLRLDFARTDQGRDIEASDDLRMRARRIRPIMGLNLPRERLSFKLHLSAAPRSLELMDFYFEYRPVAHLSFRVGQYKVPFTRYRMQSFRHLTFADWAIVTSPFGAERQMGIALHNGYEKPPKYGYAFGVFSGVNARASHATMLPAIYEETITNPSDLADPGAVPAFPPELFLQLSFNGEDLDVKSDTDESRGDFRYGAMFSAAWDLDPEKHQDFCVRLAPEFLTKYRGLSFSTIGYAGFSEVGSPSGTELSMVGGLVQTAYRISDKYEISARYAIVDFQDELIEDVSEAASRMISNDVMGCDRRSETDTSKANAADCRSLSESHGTACRPSRNGSSLGTAMVGEAFASSDTQVDAGRLVREQEVRIGMNTYIIGHTLKWQNDAGWLLHDYGDYDLTDFVVRSQFQLTF